MILGKRAFWKVGIYIFWVLFWFKNAMRILENASERSIVLKNQDGGSTFMILMAGILCKIFRIVPNPISNLW